MWLVEIGASPEWNSSLLVCSVSPASASSPALFESDEFPEIVGRYVPQGGQLPTSSPRSRGLELLFAEGRDHDIVLFEGHGVVGSQDERSSCDDVHGLASTCCSENRI